MTPAKILAFAGSNRKESFNRKAVSMAVEGAREAGAEVTLVSLGDFPMPIYDADWHQANGLPDAMLKLRALMMAANGLIIGSPEYNGSITPLLKNTIDWLSQSVNGESGLAPFSGKVCGLIGASPGAFGGVRALPHVASILSNLGVVMLPVVAVPHADTLLHPDGRVANERAANQLRQLGRRVAETVSRLADHAKQ